MSADLKPCPMCEAPGYFVWTAKGPGRVKCTRPSCGTEGGAFERGCDAKAAWNTRTADAEIKALREAGQWRSFEDAPKDGSYIVAIYRSNSEATEHWNGRAFVIRHEGVQFGYDLGWALFPGYGGVSDDRFEYWQLLSAPALSSVQKGG